MCDYSLQNVSADLHLAGARGARFLAGVDFQPLGQRRTS
jgi:hypothetical protein